MSASKKFNIPQEDFDLSINRKEKAPVAEPIVEAKPKAPAPVEKKKKSAVPKAIETKRRCDFLISKNVSRWLATYAISAEKSMSVIVEELIRELAAKNGADLA